MLFTSYSFIGFVFLLFILYYSIPKRFQWMLLLAASYIFYAVAGLQFFAYILTTTVSAWFVTRKLGDLHEEQKIFVAENKGVIPRDEIKAYKAGVKSRMWKWLLGTLFLNFGILLVIKYLNFGIANINLLLGALGAGSRLTFWTIALPLGISFYTFQTMGYVIDVYRGKYPPEQNFFKLALFVSFFPQLIQGPISRFDQLSQTLYSEHDLDWQQVTFGLQRILWGFFKKLVVADRIYAGLNTLTQAPDTYQGAWVLAAMLFYAFQLYADFTGGIDITIGIAQVLGIKLPENFQRPYFSKSIAEYWRRWHITLISWFREYVFYPLSVSGPVVKISRVVRGRLGAAAGRRTSLYISTMVVWGLTGIWHGANWKFIVWGLLNGFFLLLSVEMAPLYKRFHEKYNVRRLFLFKLFQVTRTILLISAINLFDVYKDASTTFAMLGTMFTTFNYGILFNGDLLKIGLGLADYIVILLGLTALFGVDLVQRKGSVRERFAAQPALIRYTVYYILIVSILVFGTYGVGYDANQFIYNQF